MLRALVALRRKVPTWRHVARALGVDRRTVMRARAGKTWVTAAFALRVARALGEPLGDVLAGAFPAPKGCPTCRW